MKRKSRTDWARIRTMKDEQIDYSDIAPIEKDFFKKAIVWPGTKKQITLRLDPDIIKFFRKQGRGYQSMINAVLRKYVEAHDHQIAGGKPETRFVNSCRKIEEVCSPHARG